MQKLLIIILLGSWFFSAVAYAQQPENGYTLTNISIHGFVISTHSHRAGALGMTQCGIVYDKDFPIKLYDADTDKLLKTIYSPHSYSVIDFFGWRANKIKYNHICSNSF